MEENKKKIFIGGAVVGGLWALLFTGAVGGIIGYFAATNLSPELSKVFSNITGRTIEVTSEESAVTKVVQDSSPAVVSIVIKGIDPFSGNLEEQGAGTGFIVDSSGIVVTNSHVVENANATYSVVTKDKKTYEARGISRDPVNDVAVFRIEGAGLPTLKLGDSDQVKVGQTVVAIGNALGLLDNTVTVGVVSGLGRDISDTLEGLIQTDAAINPGNSGGPLISLSGQVIGINTAKLIAENIGFAVPGNTVRTVLDNYLKNGRIIRPFLGVATRIIDKETSQLTSTPEGAFVQSVVAGSAAERAGIRRSDVITEVGGQAINEDHSLAKALSKFKAGDRVDIKLWRAGETLTVGATLAEAP
jgi:S1-C subfamily serine protease